ncbi:hypothetical protein [Bacillus sp. AFS040349]|uniref:hypothetical protein n=1 Tax=Bacillus sp. AFS040349 TaxID=2033502 RepID=UPI000BFBAB1E|nr:hypothetical protein [Bacillus sp. AFS040349]PGT83240.1 hypothetical protein COD11_12965 [Bacillus sp. AFS040349]
MFKITCFAPISPEDLGKALKALKFQEKKGCYEWYLDGHVFRIEPFKNQPRDSMKGYRVYFNGNIDGGIYLFDSALGWLETNISGVECELEIASMKSNDWIKDLISRNSFKTLDTRGLFLKGRVGVVVVNDKVNLQIRSTKGKQLKLIECLKEVNVIRDELRPDDFNLFSFIEEGVAV